MKSICIRKWDEDLFQQVLKETLAQYPTGQEIDLEDVVEYHRSISGKKNIPEMFLKAKKENKTLLTPRAGVADLNEMIVVLRYLQEVGRADILPINPDTYSRIEQFEKAASVLKESQKGGRSLLNGFPVIAHGIKGCRKVFESIDCPMVVRTATARLRLLATMAIASGITEVVSGGLSSDLCFEYDLPLEIAIRDAQFIAWLVGWLNKRGVKIAIESDTTAAIGAITTPSITIVTGIVDLLIAAYQGAKYLALAYVPMHNLIQDIAGLQVQRNLTRKYLDQFGFQDVILFQDIHQWNGPFPAEQQKANGLIAVSTAIAALYGEAEQMITKSPHEGIGVPTKEANAEGLIITRQVMTMLRGQKYPDSEQVKKESIFIEMEVESIIKKMLEMGEGDILIGAERALKVGVYEYPYGVSKYILGKVLLIRDAAGAVRYLDAGNLPFSHDILEYNREKIAQRKAYEQREEYLMLIDDLREVRASL